MIKIHIRSLNYNLFVILAMYSIVVTKYSVDSKQIEMRNYTHRQNNEVRRSDHTKNAHINEYSHSVYITTTCDGYGWSCGASILNQRLLLTAAHCFFGCTNDELTSYAYIGSKDLNKPGQKIKVKRFALHTIFKTSIGSDIAMMYLEEDIRLEKNAERVILNPLATKLTQGYVSGWETGDDEIQKLSNRVQYSVQTIYTPEECYKNFKLRPNLGDFCAQFKNGPSEIYESSGTAMLSDNFEQIGLLSTVNHAANLIYYTNTSFFYKWIIKHALVIFCYDDLTNKTEIS